MQKAMGEKMIAECSLTFTPDGQVLGLYTEVVNLSLLGKLRINRATKIEYDNKLQHWCVFNTHGAHLYSHKSRKACLEWERRYFNTNKQHKMGIPLRD